MGYYFRMLIYIVDNLRIWRAWWDLLGVNHNLQNTLNQWWKYSIFHYVIFVNRDALQTLKLKYICIHSWKLNYIYIYISTDNISVIEQIGWLVSGLLIVIETTNTRMYSTYTWSAIRCREISFKLIRIYENKIISPKMLIPICKRHTCIQTCNVTVVIVKTYLPYKGTQN